jgi:hypothetical protein
MFPTAPENILRLVMVFSHDIAPALRGQESVLGTLDETAHT